MMQSEVLFQNSWPTQPCFHSNLHRYGPNMGFYEPECHESTPENSLTSSESCVPMVGYDQDDSLDNKEVDDVCRWLCEDDDHQGIEEIQSERPAEFENVWSPCLSMISSDVYGCIPEPEPETGLQNLLKAHAEAMAMGQRELAKVIKRSVREKVNPNGPVLDRLAFNLFRCAENQGEEYLKQEAMRNFKPAFRAFYDIFPYGRFAHLTACSAILEAIPTHVESLHVIDFDMLEGTQWPLVIKAIAQQRKSLTITSVKLDDYDHDHYSQFEETRWHLCNYARSVGLNINVEKTGMDQLENMVEGRREFLAFNCMIDLPHMGRTKTRTRTQAMEFLKLAKAILAKNEGVITFGDGEDGEIWSSYGSYFDGTLAHYKALYESMEWGFPSYLSEARMAMETLFVAPFISSLSWFQKWGERREEVILRKDLGLKGRRMSRESWNEARELVKEGESPYGIRIEGDSGNGMVLEFRGTPLVKVFCWV